MGKGKSRIATWLVGLLVSSAVLMVGSEVRASEADLAIPDLHAGSFDIFGTEVSAWNLLFYGALVICGTLGISLYLRGEIKKMPAHSSMLNIAEIIYQTCKTYLLQQGKFLLMLFVLIAIAISYYLLAFGGTHEYQLTDRTMQELNLYPPEDSRIPDAVLADLAPLQEQTFESRDAYLAAIQERLSSEEWQEHGDTIAPIAAPVPIDPYLKVALVLLFSVVGICG
jgi:hypothetical protein